MIGSASSALVTAVSVPGVSVSVTGVGSYLPVAGIAAAMAGVAAMAAGRRSSGHRPQWAERRSPGGHPGTVHRGTVSRSGSRVDPNAES
jgi:hypothetical protein